jgi:hypothetical protein
MSKFTLPFSKAANKPGPRVPDVDLSALEAFAPGARAVETKLADPDQPAWSSLDKTAPPKNTLSIRVNDYHLAINPATIYSTVRRHRRWISPENTIAPDGVASELT